LHSCRLLVLQAAQVQAAAATAAAQAEAAPADRGPPKPTADALLLAAATLALQGPAWQQELKTCRLSQLLVLLLL
jgi:hypothetical protein